MKFNPSNPPDEMQSNLFYGGATGEMKSAGKLATSVTDVHSDELLEALASWELYNTDFESVVDALTSFRAYIQGYQKLAAYTPTTISLSLSFRVGSAGVMEMSLAGIPNEDTDRAYRDMFNDLRDHYGKLAEHYTKIFGKPPQETSGSIPHPADDKKSNGAEFDTFEGTHFTTEIKGDKKYVRIHGGRWQKFGVPVWDDVLAPAGYNLADISHNQPLKRTVIALMENGKPKKIVRFADK